MRATLMYGAGDVRVENVPDPARRRPIIGWPASKGAQAFIPGRHDLLDSPKGEPLCLKSPPGRNS